MVLSSGLLLIVLSSGLLLASVTLLCVPICLTGPAWSLLLTVRSYPYGLSRRKCSGCQHGIVSVEHNYKCCQCPRLWRHMQFYPWERRQLKSLLSHPVRGVAWQCPDTAEPREGRAPGSDLDTTVCNSSGNHTCFWQLKRPPVTDDSYLRVHDFKVFCLFVCLFFMLFAWRKKQHNTVSVEHE